MKLKISLLTSLTFLLVACPSKEEDIYINIDNLGIQATCFNDKENLKDTVICEDEFIIYLDFKTSQIAQTTSFSSAVGVAYATYEPIVYLNNNVIKCRISNTEVFDNHPKGTEVNNYFELYIDNSNWIHDLSMIEGINEAARLQYFQNIRPYLKLKDHIDYDGKIVVKLELSDGKELSDTTNIIKIIKAD